MVTARGISSDILQLVSGESEDGSVDRIDTLWRIVFDHAGEGSINLLLVLQNMSDELLGFSAKSR